MSNPGKNFLYTLPIALKQGLRHPKRKLLLLGLIPLSITTLGIKQELVEAQEAKITNQQTAYINNWQNASFPVENFQGYTSPFGPRGRGFHYGLDCCRADSVLSFVLTSAAVFDQELEGVAEERDAAQKKLKVPILHYNESRTG